MNIDTNSSGNRILHGIKEVFMDKIYYKFELDGQFLISETKNKMTVDEFNLHMTHLNALEKEWLSLMNKMEK